MQNSNKVCVLDVDISEETYGTTENVMKFLDS